MKKYIVDRNELPYDAMVADPSWIMIEDDEKGEGDGDQGKKAQAYSDQSAGGKPREETTE